MQVQQRAWVQRDGRDEQDETRDLIISPAIFTFKPGETQVVRIALRGSPDPQVERAYRILVSELPPPHVAAAPEVFSFRIALRMDLPLFVAAVEPGTPAPSFEFERASGRLVVRNEGRSHIRFTDFTLQQAGRQLHSVPVFTVLPGSSISLELPKGDRCDDGRERAGGGGQQCRPDQRRRRAALGAAPRPPSRFQPPSPRMARRRGAQSPDPLQLAAAPAEIAVLTVTFEGKASPGIAYAVREGSDLLLDVDTLARLGIAYDPSTTRTVDGRVLAPLGAFPGFAGA